jgi:hypothetical protein
MNYKHLALECACGDTPESLAEVGFTDDHQLVVHWWCLQCSKVVYVCKPLTECWQECPSPEQSLDHALERLTGANGGTAESADAEFLRSIGVRY